MDAETLKELIKAFQEMGGEAKGAFIWYLVMTHGLGYLIGLIWTLIAGGVIVSILKMVWVAVREANVTYGIGPKIWSRDDLNATQEMLVNYFREKDK